MGFLGAVPLAFSSSALFFTIFVAFLGMGVLGSAHGLILLPVLLSILGPKDQVTSAFEGKASPDDQKEPNVPEAMTKEEIPAVEAVPLAPAESTMGTLNTNGQISRSISEMSDASDTSSEI